MLCRSQMPHIYWCDSTTCRYQSAARRSGGLRDPVRLSFPSLHDNSISNCFWSRNYISCYSCDFGNMSVENDFIQSMRCFSLVLVCYFVDQFDFCDHFADRCSSFCRFPCISYSGFFRTSFVCNQCILRSFCAFSGQS